MMTDYNNDLDNVTAYGETDAPPSMAVTTSGQNGVTDEQPTISNNNRAARREPLTFGARNLRTTNDSDTSIRPERATATGEQLLFAESLKKQV